MTREICKACNRPSPVGFQVPGDVWAAVVPDRYGVLCVQCFVTFADEAGVRWCRNIQFFPVSLAAHLEG